MSEVCRLFAAVLLPEAVRRACVGLQDALRPRGVPVRWVPPDNLHITMVFMGETGVERIDGVRAALDAACAGIAPFTAVTGAAGYFGSRRAPRVLWLGLERGADACGFLYARMAEHLAAIGFRSDAKRYHPHITLGRVRATRRAAELTSGLDSIKTDAVGYDVPVDRAVLIRSALSPRGSKYTILHETPLKGAE